MTVTAALRHLVACLVLEITSLYHISMLQLVKEQQRTGVRLSLVTAPTGKAHCNFAFLHVTL
jgi:hypothetical protein